MDLPLYISSKIEEMLEGYKISSLKEISFSLIDNYQNETGKEVNFITSELVAKVYASIRLPATFNAVYSSLSYVKEYYHNEIKSHLDVGSGLGTSVIASTLLFDLEHITCLEKEDNMIKIGKELLDNYDINWKKFDVLTDTLIDKADLVTASYLLNELSDSHRLIVVDSLWEKTNKVLLIVEPGTKKGYQIIKKVREHLINKGGYLIAPCPHMDKCPLSSDDWCHFSTRVNRSKLHRLLKEGDVPYEDEKYIYVAFSKDKCDRCSSRVLRHPITNKGCIRLELCDKNGLSQVDIRKSDKDNYKKAKKCNWGDSF